MLTLVSAERIVVELASACMHGSIESYVVVALLFSFIYLCFCVCACMYGIQSFAFSFQLHLSCLASSHMPLVSNYISYTCFVPYAKFKRLKCP